MCELFDIAYDDVEIIKDLWEKNRLYHEKLSEFFKEFYRSVRFEQRIKAFGELDADKVKITVARDGGEYIGYCISTAIDGKGELESLHVDEASRGLGVGKKLALGHLAWMREKGCKVIGVTVSHENAATISFYRKLGFVPNTLYMQQP